MQAVFKSELTETEVRDIQKFCSSVDYFALEQSIGFSRILYNTKITYFYLLDGEIIKSFCQVNENLKFAHIWYGPVCNDKEDIITTINEIVRHYKKRGFWYLGVQMYLKSGSDCDFIEYQLNKFNKISYIFNNENTKSSLEIDLSKNIDDIFRGFRKGHRSDIKRAINSGIHVEEAAGEEDIRVFSAVYRKMCKSRSIGGHTASEIEELINYIESNRMGKLLVARDTDNSVIGGAIFAYQGISVRYLISASDPDKRDLPMTHLIIYKALEMGKAGKFKYFDFWGYNHFADSNDQIYKVNSFKKGFGGYYTFFAKKMNFNLVPGGYNIYRLFGVMKRMKGKFKGKE